MLSLVTHTQGLKTLARNLQDRRLALGLTQAGLSVRSGVPLGTLRKFEQTGLASTEALMKLLIAVGAAEPMIRATEPEPTSFSSIDDVLQAEPKPARKRGWRT